MQDRLRRIAATGLSTVEVANRLGTSDEALLHWIDDELSVESADVVEVALSLLELDLSRTQTRFYHCQETPLQPLLAS
jgi:hypothetical protein